MIVGGAALGAGLDELVADLPRRPWIEGVVLALSLDQQAAFRRVLAVSASLRLLGGSLDRARGTAATALGSWAGRLDQHGIARIAIEESALRFARGIVSPLLWFALLGLPGLLAVSAADAVHTVSGARPSYGRSARIAEAAIAFLPARLAGLLLAFASAGVPGARAEKALPGMLRRYPGLRSVNAGWPLGAVAGALGLSLAGPSSRESIGGDAWIAEEGRARATSGDVDRMLLLYTVACGLLAGVLAAGWGLASAIGG